MKKKKLFIIICAVFLAAAVVGIILFSGANQPLSSSVRKEIESAWREQYGRDFPGWYSRSNPFRVCYYGEYNGCHILFYATDLGVASTEVVAGESFMFWSSNIFCAYRDGEFISVSEAYENGWIDEDDVAKIADKHNRTYDEFIP